ncbi:MAG TPA: MFS transporter [Steroidobacteraceae bacterium]|nr:MFS transporter [Steroidobacteraceae bacterium]
MTRDERSLRCHPDSQAPARGQRAPGLKLALLGVASASIEWYDFLLYAVASALVFPRVFFPPTLPPLVALIASFSTFAVGFVARPIGGVLFGHMGDKRGRKRALSLALIIMGAATTIIGLLPSYESSGAFSPLVLVAMRFLQGLAVGGQWGGAILLATESAPESSRGWYGSLVQAGVPIGVLLANLALLAVNALTSPAAFIAYGWRIPFLLSIALVGFGVYLEYRVEDTAAFRRLTPTAAAGASRAEPGDASSLETQMQGASRSPVVEALRRYPGRILIAAGAYISTPLTFYLLVTYVIAYATGSQHLARGTVLAAQLIASAAIIPVTFLAGRLSDRYGRRPLFMAGVALSGLWAFALFPLVDTRSFAGLTVALLAGSTWTSLSYGPLAAMFTELFDTRLRYSAASLAYQIGTLFGAALGPIIATLLYEKYRSNVPVSIYMASVCALSLSIARMLEETRRAAVTTRLQDRLEH